MWNISKQARDNFANYNLLPIHESDHEWDVVLREAKEEGEDIHGRLKQELEEVKAQLLQFLPSRFIPYVEDETLNQPTLDKAVREDYLSWMREGERKLENILDAASLNTDKAVSFLPENVQVVFADSLHDARIERIEREKDALHFYINTADGFTPASYIHLIFQQVTAEETDYPLEVGQYIVYYELQKTEDGFAFRVLFESPQSEWTISMKGMDAAYYYRPSRYTILRDEERVDKTTLEEFMAELNPNHRYWFITPDAISLIPSLVDPLRLENGKIEFFQKKMVVTAGNDTFGYDLAEYHPIEFVHTDVFENPYAHLYEPMPKEEIEAAALGDDVELQVRAWNTMYADAYELVDVINRVMGKLEVTEENEMMAAVYANHFYQEGVLSDANMEKFAEFIRRQVPGEMGSSSKPVMHKKDLASKAEIWNACISVLSGVDFPVEDPSLNEASLVYHYYSALESGGHEALLNWFGESNADLGIDNHLKELMGVLEKIGATDYATIWKKYGQELWKLYVALENNEVEEDEFYAVVRKADGEYYGLEGKLEELLEAYFVGCYMDWIDVVEE